MCISLLDGQDLTAEENGKLFQFLCEIGTKYHCALSQTKITKMNKQMVTWLQTPQTTSAYSSNLFNSSDSSSISEVDGSPAGESFTVLTLGKYEQLN